MLWKMHIKKHKRSYGHPLHSDMTSCKITCSLPLDTVRSRREVFLTYENLRFSAHKLLHTQLNHYTFTYTQTRVMWRLARSEAVDGEHVGSCSNRPAHRRLSFIWSLSVRGRVSRRLSDSADLIRISVAWGGRYDGSVSNCLLQLPWPVNRNQLGPLLVVENKDQRTNGPVNAHLISEQIISTNPRHK